MGSKALFFDLEILIDLEYFNLFAIIDLDIFNIGQKVNPKTRSDNHFTCLRGSLPGSSSKVIKPGTSMLNHWKFITSHPRKFLILHKP